MATPRSQRTNAIRRSTLKRGASLETSRKHAPTPRVSSRVTISEVTLPARVLTLTSLAFLVASIILVSVSVSAPGNAPFVLAMVGFALAAMADALDRRRCDRLGVSDRLLSAAVLQVTALVTAIVCAYLVARAAAL